MPKRIFFDPQPKHAPTARVPVTAHLRRPPVNGVIRWHRHAWGQLVCPLQGSVRVSAPGITWIVPTFRAVWIPPKIDHEVSMFGSVTFHAMYLHPGTSPLALDTCTVVEVPALMHNLMVALTGDTLKGRRRDLMMALFVEELRAATPIPLGLPFPMDRRLKLLCEAIINEPESTLSLSSWARVVGASERTLARLFQSELGSSFGAWRRQARLAKATVLIGEGLPLSQVALAAGYSSGAAFSAMFRKALGVPPSRFLLSGRR